MKLKIKRFLVYFLFIIFICSVYQVSWAVRNEIQVDFLAREVQDANQKLQEYLDQVAQLFVARERNRLARDLHDSVTQTVFSMTLTTQSAMLLLERDPVKVERQLERLSQLARNALSEMQVLISELKPDEADAEALVGNLKRYLADGHLPEGLSVSLEIQGEQRLAPSEKEGLFRIIQEAFNNIVKHAHTSTAHVRLHLVDPMWIEIEDDGRGFDLGQAQSGGRVGLSSMRERAEMARGKELRKGPRGGGRTLEKITDHILESEKGYLSSLGGKVTLQEGITPSLNLTRQTILQTLQASADGKLPTHGPRGGKRWSARYFVRRDAWHILDHIWEIEDRLEEA